MSEENPIIEFEKDAAAPIIRYDLPSPSSYEGKIYIEIDIDNNIEKLFDEDRTKKKPIYREIIKKYRNEIQEYLINSRKLDLERDLYLTFELKEFGKEETIISHRGTFNFQEDSIGESQPSGFSNIYPPNTGGEVISEIDGHTKVLRVYDNNNKAYAIVKQVFSEAGFNNQTHGTIEYYHRATSVYHNTNIRVNWSTELKDNAFALGTRRNKWSINSDLGWQHISDISPDIPPPQANKWHHVRIAFRCNGAPDYLNLGEGEFEVTLDGVSGGIYKFREPHSEIAMIVFHTEWGPYGNTKAFFDAIGYSWDPDYTIGDNLEVSETLLGILDKIGSVNEEYLTLLNRIEEKFDDQGNIIDFALKEKNDFFNYYVQVALEIDNRVPIFYRTMGGKLKIRFVEVPEEPEPRFMFVETHKITSFPGDYGAGTTIKTFSLLPREITEISVKTWKKTTEQTQKASSILDSYTTEKADEFERNIQAESARTSKIDTSFSYNVNASVSASWGWGKASVSGGINGSTNSSREEAVKNVMNATAKHSQSASAQREVNIDTSFERSVEEGIETAIMRTIRNLNVSRTLNFTFRQMNQEFHSISHLTDLRLAFYNGYPGSYREYGLCDLGYLVDKYMTDYGTCYPYFYEIIKTEYGSSKDDQGNLVGNMLDYQGNLQALVEEATDNVGKYLRVKPPFDKEGKPYGQQQYHMRPEKTDSNGNVIQEADIRFLDGVILGSQVLTLKTDGVIVEALMGKVNALDDYSYAYRTEKIRKKNFENQRIEVGLNLVKELMQAGKLNEAIQAYKQIFGVEPGIDVLKDLFTVKLETSKE